MNNLTKTLTISALLAVVSSASAQTIYVDATEGISGNTAIAPSAGGGVFTSIPQSNTPNDGLWDGRAFGNSATIFQNAGTTAAVDTNAVRLATSVSGLAADSYNVYVYFWTDNSPTWRIGASLTDSPGQLPLFQSGGAGVTQFYTGSDATVLSSTLTPNPFTTSVVIAEGNRRLLQGYVGTFTGTSVSVFIEGDRSMTTFNQRTWYDGVGYSVVPEPSTATLFGLGTLAGTFILRRRRK
jgi:hypothetical protein